jgi:hypothetical protein
MPLALIVHAGKELVLLCNSSITINLRKTASPTAKTVDWISFLLASA